MNPGEHELMARVEDDHWWYRGLRDLLGRTLSGPSLGLPEHPRILDAGCGTGRNLAALRELLSPAYLGGFDASEEALHFAREKAPGADLWRGDICDPDLHATNLDLVVSLDVLYIPGFSRARPGLERIVGALRPNGLFVLNLPAYDWLFSEHDLAIHTSERYTAGKVHLLLDSLGLHVELLTYRLCMLFPLVVAARLPSLLGKRPDDDSARSDLHRVPSAPMNRALHAALRVENTLIARGVRFPFGSSVYAVGRRCP